MQVTDTGFSMEAPRVGSLEMVTYASFHSPDGQGHLPGQQAGAITESKSRGMGRTDDVTDDWLREAISVAVYADGARAAYGDRVRHADQGSGYVTEIKGARAVVRFDAVADDTASVPAGQLSLVKRHPVLRLR